MKTQIQQCRICKLTLPVSSFYSSPTNKSGLQYDCKECWRERNYRKYPDTLGNKEANGRLYKIPDNVPEIWRPVPGFGTIFSVSNLGRVRRNDVRVEGVKCVRPGFLAPTDDHGYLIARFQTPIHGKRRWRIHRLVAEVFIGEAPFENAQVNHKDGDRKNNFVDNLEWCSQYDNLQHQHRVLGSTTFGEKGTNARFKDAEIPVLRERLAKQSANSLAKELGVSPRTLDRIRNRETYFHIP